MPRHDAGSEAPLSRDLAIDGVDVEHVASTGSTNADLVARAPTLARPVLRVADVQTEGRGRLGRSWQSAPGRSLTFSLAWPLRRESATGLSLAVGVALAEALGCSVVVKWPNDLGFVDSRGWRKLGGILIEAVAGASARLAVVGVGINLQRGVVADAPYALAALDEMQRGIVADAPYALAALDEIDPDANADATLARLAPALVAAMRRFDDEGFGADARARFAARDALAGRAVRIVPVRDDDPAASALGTTGIAEGIADDGALRVRLPGGGVTLVSSGEVSVRVAAEGAC